MDNPTTLIVAIMYVTIISIGLSNLLMALSDIIGRRVVFPDKIHLSWLVLLTLAYFGFFWQTTLILEVENWQFLYFVAFLLGPVCLLFATNMLISMPEYAEQKREHFLEISNRSFLLLGLFFGWIVGLDVVTASVAGPTFTAALFALLCAVLMLSNSYPVQKSGFYAACVVFLVSMALNLRADVF